MEETEGTNTSPINITPSSVIDPMLDTISINGTPVTKSPVDAPAPPDGVPMQISNQVKGMELKSGNIKPYVDSVSSSAEKAKKEKREREKLERQQQREQKLKQLAEVNKLKLEREKEAQQLREELEKKEKEEQELEIKEYNDDGGKKIKELFEMEDLIDEEYDITEYNAEWINNKYLINQNIRTTGLTPQLENYGKNLRLFFEKKIEAVNELTDRKKSDNKKNFVGDLTIQNDQMQNIKAMILGDSKVKDIPPDKLGRMIDVYLSKVGDKSGEIMQKDYDDRNRTIKYLLLIKEYKENIEKINIALALSKVEDIAINEVLNTFITKWNEGSSGNLLDNTSNLMGDDEDFESLLAEMNGGGYYKKFISCKPCKSNKKLRGGTTDTYDFIKNDVGEIIIPEFKDFENVINKYFIITNDIVTHPNLILEFNYLMFKIQNAFYNPLEIYDGYFDMSVINQIIQDLENNYKIYNNNWESIMTGGKKIGKKIKKKYKGGGEYFNNLIRSLKNEDLKYSNSKDWKEAMNLILIEIINTDTLEKIYQMFTDVKSAIREISNQQGQILLKLYQDFIVKYRGAFESITEMIKTCRRIQHTITTAFKFSRFDKSIMDKSNRELNSLSQSLQIFLLNLNSYNYKIFNTEIFNTEIIREYEGLHKKFNNVIQYLYQNKIIDLTEYNDEIRKVEPEANNLTLANTYSQKIYDNTNFLTSTEATSLDDSTGASESSELFKTIDEQIAEILYMNEKEIIDLIPTFIRELKSVKTPEKIAEIIMDIIPEMYYEEPFVESTSDEDKEVTQNNFPHRIEMVSEILKSIPEEWSGPVEKILKENTIQPKKDQEEEEEDEEETLANNKASMMRTQKQMRDDISNSEAEVQKMESGSMKSLSDLKINKDKLERNLKELTQDINKVKESEKPLYEKLIEIQRIADEKTKELETMASNCVKVFGSRADTLKKELEESNEKLKNIDRSLVQLNNNVMRKREEKTELEDNILIMNQVVDINEELLSDDKLFTDDIIITGGNDISEKDKFVEKYIKTNYIKNNLYNFVEECKKLDSVSEWRALISKLIVSYMTVYLEDPNNSSKKVNVMPSYEYFNLVLMGTPGVGKSYTSAIIGKALKWSGLLTIGDMKEIKKPDIVGSYTGQTAPKVYNEMTQALGKIVFLDEAYSVAGPKDKTKNSFNEFGQEALDAITDYTSEHIGLFGFVAAGYEYEMRNQFLNVNIGLPRRFPTQIVLRRYDLKSFWKILEGNISKFCKKSEVQTHHRACFELLNLLFNFQCIPNPTIRLSKKWNSFWKGDVLNNLLLNLEITIPNNESTTKKINVMKLPNFKDKLNEMNNSDSSNFIEKSITSNTVQMLPYTEILKGNNSVVSSFLKSIFVYLFSRNIFYASDKILNGDFFRSQADNLTKFGQIMLENKILKPTDSPYEPYNKNINDWIQYVYFRLYFTRNPNKKIHNIYFSLDPLQTEDGVKMGGSYYNKYNRNNTYRNILSRKKKYTRRETKIKNKITKKYIEKQRKHKKTHRQMGGGQKEVEIIEKIVKKYTIIASYRLVKIPPSGFPTTSNKRELEKVSRAMESSKIQALNSINTLTLDEINQLIPIVSDGIHNLNIMLGKSDMIKFNNFIANKFTETDYIWNYSLFENGKAMIQEILESLKIKQKELEAITAPTAPQPDAEANVELVQPADESKVEAANVEPGQPADEAKVVAPIEAANVEPGEPEAESKVEAANVEPGQPADEAKVVAANVEPGQPEAEAKAEAANVEPGQPADEAKVVAANVEPGQPADEAKVVAANVEPGQPEAEAKAEAENVEPGQPADEAKAEAENVEPGQPADEAKAEAENVEPGQPEAEAKVDAAGVDAPIEAANMQEVVPKQDVNLVFNFTHVYLNDIISNVQEILAVFDNSDQTKEKFKNYREITNKIIDRDIPDDKILANWIYVFILLYSNYIASQEVQKEEGAFNTEGWWFFTNSDFQIILKELNIDLILSKFDELTLPKQEEIKPKQEEIKQPQLTKEQIREKRLASLVPDKKAEYIAELIRTNNAHPNDIERYNDWFTLKHPLNSPIINDKQALILKTLIDKNLANNTEREKYNQWTDYKKKTMG